jgi:hypothetical protein
MDMVLLHNGPIRKLAAHNRKHTIEGMNYQFELIALHSTNSQHDIQLQITGLMNQW